MRTSRLLSPRPEICPLRIQDGTFLLIPLRNFFYQALQLLDLAVEFLHLHVERAHPMGSQGLSFLD